MTLSDFYLSSLSERHTLLLGNRDQGDGVDHTITLIISCNSDGDILVMRDEGDGADDDTMMAP